jgi:UDP-N-acetylmuramoylalanine--D-glutamate ligase
MAAKLQDAPDGRRPDLRGKSVVVFGLARSGLAAIDLLLEVGARVTALDKRSLAELGDAVAPFQSRVTLALGPTPQDLLVKADLVVTSPGVPLALPELQTARKAGVTVWGEVELAWRCLEPGPVLGITGTNGKSTTTALCGELMRRAGRRPFVGGNLGRPLSEAAHAPGAQDSYVVELSSFQLESIDALRADAAAILNLTLDHLDRYPNPQAYAEAKARIFRNQTRGDLAVVNLDDAAVLGLAAGAHAAVRGFTLRADAPRPAGVSGLARPVDGGFAFDFSDARFVLRNKALRGAHNVQNAMAAALLASHAGASTSAIQEGLDRYPGLAHRLELVRSLAGVEWINDSKATNVDSTLVALQAFPGNIWLVAGGRGKGAPYAPMVEASRKRVKGVLTIGEDGPAIAAAYLGQLPVHPCETLERAVTLARELAQPGDVVLLSPACASYDQFKNFEHRGESFKRWVRGLS